MINWEVIVWTSVTVGVLLGTTALLLTFTSIKNVKKRTAQLENLHKNLKVGSKIMFSGAIFGVVVGIDDDKLQVEIAKNVVITISRYSVQSIEK